MSKIHGEATIRINGQVYESNDAELEPGGQINSKKMVGRKTYDSESYEMSKVTCKIPVTVDVSLTDLQKMRAAEVTFTSDIGKVWIIRDAAQTNKLKVSSGKDGGLAELVFEGEPAEEMEV